MKKLASNLVQSSSVLYESPKSKVFFPNLNGLRFLAAFMVIVHHTEQIRNRFGLPNSWNNPVVYQIGSLGVTLFFVLSGFLITYLLLAEKEKFSTVSIKNFYVRRALRIWPLYYFVVLIALFVLSGLVFFKVPGLTEHVKENIRSKLALYALILPNVVWCIYPSIPYAAQTWSIGVEEQFYLLWPLIIKHTKRYFLVITVMIIFFVFITQLPSFLASPRIHMLERNSMMISLEMFADAFRIQCMCIGALYALVLFFEKEKILYYIMSVSMQVLLYVTVCVLVLNGKPIWHFTNEVYSILFGAIILNLAAAKKSVVKLQGKAFDFLGKISYSLYMLHMIAVVVGVKICSFIFADTGSIQNRIITHVIVLSLTVLLAAVSYKFIEMPFLRFKKVFVKIDSGAK